MIGQMYFIVAMCLTLGVTAFAPSSKNMMMKPMLKHTSFVFQPSHIVQNTRIATFRNLSSKEPESDSEDASTAVSTDGTFYDDEVRVSRF
jgi:hypothetical protein